MAYRPSDGKTRSHFEEARLSLCGLLRFLDLGGYNSQLYPGLLTPPDVRRAGCSIATRSVSEAELGSRPRLRFGLRCGGEWSGLPRPLEPQEVLACELSFGWPVLAIGCY